jgi:hypothetical protein
MWQTAEQTAGRFHQRPVALHQRRPAPDQPQPALDRRHRDRGLHLPARALFARLGHRPCPQCGQDVPPPTFESAAEDWQDESDESPDEQLPLPALRRGGTGDGHGELLVQQARRRLPHLHRPGRRAPGDHQPPGRREQEHRSRTACPAVGSSSTSTTTARSCEAPGVTTASTSTRKAHPRVHYARETCCYLAPTARSFRGTSLAPSRRRPTRRAASRAS